MASAIASRGRSVANAWTDPDCILGNLPHGRIHRKIHTSIRGSRRRWPLPISFPAIDALDIISFQFQQGQILRLEHGNHTGAAVCDIPLELGDFYARRDDELESIFLYQGAALS